MKKKPEKINTTRSTEKTLEHMSPFELKNNLIALAEKSYDKSSHAMLNAGRGNPNWIATLPREAFFLLGKFGLQECRRSMDHKEGLAGIPGVKGIAERFENFLSKNQHEAGQQLLQKLYNYGEEKQGFDPDAFVHELAEGVIGDQYPVPDRMLRHPEAIVHDYLAQEMCAGKPPKGKYDLFAVEGGTAAMCYIFDSLMQNFLVDREDKVALFVPVFTPYIEIPELDRFKFKVTHIKARGLSKEGDHNWEYPDKELDKLKNPDIKVAFLVNPSNPPSVALSEQERKKIVDIVKKDNPNLMFITDDVYGTFVNGFRSLMAEIPHNTLGVYSFSKYFGCTGWRLGVIALHEKNIYDRMIKELPQSKKNKLFKRYNSIHLHPEKLKFIDRMVADSRMVALNHTAGLSLPQQIQMMLFAAFALFDKENAYKQLAQKIVQHRYHLLFEGMGFEIKHNPASADYYAELDVMLWAKKNYGKDFAKYLKKNYEPVDILFRLAELCSVVLLNGGGFDAPEWSVRVSLANLTDEAYVTIAESLKKIVEEYIEDWESKG
ncbi:MAG: aspartate 4-decarboxylase [Bacteroidales bacterium]|nr:aspartate 4-decarboxylase [Bacteroidales bacterium]MCF8350127.1 aspartate 4-decarboxylase [Bacteroidales bacterium]MCF8376185.1 aspartate 4-decarboxylase [Bacteroidales bacterium]MCF8401149.1 aspartate 4-decarboxylase [Bacteroidales bacterium]